MDLPRMLQMLRNNIRSRKNYIGLTSLVLLQLAVVPRPCFSGNVTPVPDVLSITVRSFEPVYFQTDQNAIRIEAVPHGVTGYVCLVRGTQRIDLSALDDPTWGRVPEEAYYEFTLLSNKQVSIGYRKRRLVIFIFNNVDNIPWFCDMKYMNIAFSGVNSLRYSIKGDEKEDTIRTIIYVDDVTTNQTTGPEESNSTEPVNVVISRPRPVDNNVRTTTSIFTRVLYVIGGIVLSSVICCAMYVCYVKSTWTDNTTRVISDNSMNENSFPLFPGSLANNHARMESPMTPSVRSSQLELDLPPSYYDLQENQPPPSYSDLKNHRISRPSKGYAP